MGEFDHFCISFFKYYLIIIFENVANVLQRLYSYSQHLLHVLNNNQTRRVEGNVWLFDFYNILYVRGALFFNFVRCSVLSPAPNIILSTKDENATR